MNVEKSAHADEFVKQIMYSAMGYNRKVRLNRIFG